MLKGSRGKSTARKPFDDISNGGAKPSRRRPKERSPAGGGGDHDGALDRLFLVRSDLSSLVAQIDELVAQALEHKTISRKGSQDIESFSHVLSDVHLSLKPWVSKFKQSLIGTSTTAISQLNKPFVANSVSCANRVGDVAIKNKKEPELDLVVSPSPLVSWRAGACTLESGRQLFLLTPLPKPKLLSSKRPDSSKPVRGILPDKTPHGNIELHALSTASRNSHHNLLKSVDFKPVPSDISRACPIEENNNESESRSVSPLEFPNHNSRRFSICLLTPCLKSSQPKSSVLLDEITENISEPTQTSDLKGSDDLFGGEASESLTSRYQEFCFQPTYNFASRRKEVDGTLDWFLSPPKTCVLMEPSDEKLQTMPANDGVPLATPLWKDVESTVRKGKQAGENTLKRELWTRFEAVSTKGLKLDTSVFPKTARKGFLDMLEEVSCETNDSDCRLRR